MNNSKKVYMTPMLEVMNARVEKGFAGSGDPFVDNTEPIEEGNGGNGGGNHSGLIDMD